MPEKSHSNWYRKGGISVQSQSNITTGLLFGGQTKMPNSVYKQITLVGSSPESWEKAAENDVAMASKTLRNLRIAEVIEMDMQLEGGKVFSYRTKVRLSFKVEDTIQA